MDASEFYSSEFFGEILLGIGTFFNGIAIVGQRQAMLDGTIGPFTYSAGRYIVSAIAVLAIRPLLKRGNNIYDRYQDHDKEKIYQDRFKLWFWGFLTALAVTGGSVFQQLALVTTSASKVAFMGGMYVVLTPLVVVFIPHMNRHVTVWSWIAAVISVIGLYFVAGCTPTDDDNSCSESSLITMGELYAVISMVFWVAAVITMNVGANRLQIDPVDFTIVMFVFTALLFIPLSLGLEFGEFSTWTFLSAHWLNMLIVGLVIAAYYVFRIYGQVILSPSKSSIILSFSAVVCAVVSYFYLGEQLAAEEILGCCLMLLAVIVSSLWGNSVTLIPPELAELLGREEQEENPVNAALEVAGEQDSVATSGLRRDSFQFSQEVVDERTSLLG